MFYGDNKYGTIETVEQVPLLLMVIFVLETRVFLTLFRRII